MPRVIVHRLENEKAAFLQELQDTLDGIRRTAFEWFERRDRGNDLDAWFQAERDLFWAPAAELAEAPQEFRMQMGVPEFGTSDLEVAALADSIILKASAQRRAKKRERGPFYCEFGAKSLFRQFAFPAPIEMARVTASLDRGTLTVVAPKKRAA
jgi:HSP20 family molecular chaperone IbpA